MVMAQSTADRQTQLEAIRSVIKCKIHHSVRYNIKSDTIIIGNKQLVFELTPEMLDRDDYLDIVQVSFGRLLEACDQWLETVPAEGRA